MVLVQTYSHYITGPIVLLKGGHQDYVHLLRKEQCKFVSIFLKKKKEKLEKSHPTIIWFHFLIIPFTQHKTLAQHYRQQKFENMISDFGRYSFFLLEFYFQVSTFFSAIQVNLVTMNSSHAHTNTLTQMYSITQARKYKILCQYIYILFPFCTLIWGKENKRNKNLSTRQK